MSYANYQIVEVETEVDHPNLKVGNIILDRDMGPRRTWLITDNDDKQIALVRTERREQITDPKVIEMIQKRGL